MLHGSAWHPTPVLVRAALGSAALAVTAVVMGRPDLLVLAAPLLVHAVAAVVRRPATVPRAGDAVLGTDHVREGEGTTVRVLVDHADDVEHAVLALTRHRHLVARPPSGMTDGTLAPEADRLELAVPVASLRWGRRRVGDGLVAATTPWSGYLWGPLPVAPQHLTTLPQPGLFDSRAASPHPIGLVGQHPARRRGDGSEFESIRPFQPGDRLRRVQWRVSLRTGRLHATSTVAEEDASVLVTCRLPVRRLTRHCTRRSRSPGWKGRMLSNSEPSPRRRAGCWPTSPIGCGDAVRLSKTPGCGSTVRSCANSGTGPQA